MTKDVMTVWRNEFRHEQRFRDDHRYLRLWVQLVGDGRCMNDADSSTAEHVIMLYQHDTRACTIPLHNSIGSKCGVQQALRPD